MLTTGGLLPYRATHCTYGTLLIFVRPCRVVGLCWMLNCILYRATYGAVLRHVRVIHFVGLDGRTNCR